MLIKISGNNLLPFHFLPHALNISLFMIAAVNGQDLPRLKAEAFPRSLS